MTGTPLDDARDALIAVQGQLIVVLAARNAGLEARNTELEARVADLEKRLARLERAVSRNSGNSSMPHTVPLFLRGACACGRDLTAAPDLGVAASHQVIDVPLVTAAVTQYDEHVVECACGRLHQAVPPPEAGAAGTVTYGLNIQTWCAFLMVAHHVPVERCAEIIASLSGARPSDGFVHAMLARAAQAVRAVNMLIRALIITAAVISADETPSGSALARRPARNTCSWRARTC